MRTLVSKDQGQGFYKPAIQLPHLEPVHRPSILRFSVCERFQLSEAHPRSRACKTPKSIGQSLALGTRGAHDAKEVSVLR